MPTKVVPFKDSDESKTQQVAKMFDEIAPRYDYLNHLLSMGIDKRWRKKAISMLREKSPEQILDVATGTGDFAIDALHSIPDAHITGIDISEGMLEVGQAKLIERNLENQVKLLQGNSEAMRFDNSMFDAITCAFGVRNFDNLERGLSEMHRVLREDGSLYILEFSRPRLFPFKQLYNLYFRYILPQVGNRISRSKTAYSYLPESVSVFPDGDEMLKILENIGFKNAQCKRLTLGIASIYSASK